MSSPEHVCDDKCVCPYCGTALVYSPRWNEHACQDIDCYYGDRGILKRKTVQSILREGVWGYGEAESPQPPEGERFSY